jgi:hypothetical protein
MARWNWRNIFRFRLRTLLLVFSALSVWLGFHVHSTEKQRDAVAAIQKYGGWVRYDFQYPSGEYDWNDFDSKARSPVPRWLIDRLGFDFFHDVVHVSLNYSEDSGKRDENHNPSDEALQYLPEFSDLRVLLLSDTQASDTSMQYLAKLKKLECLMMWDVTNVTDAGAAHLGGLRNLHYIHLTTSQITDNSLAMFARLPKIRGLSLQFNDFSDKGLKDVSRCKDLENLWVCGRSDRPNEITDAGLKQLENLTKLTHLGIQNTRITPKGLDQFSKAVPGCRVSK